MRSFFLLEAKITAFKSTISGNLFRTKKISRCRNKIHMEFFSTCSLSQYLPCYAWKWVNMILFTSIRTTKKHDFCHFPFARLFLLVEEIKSWSMMRTHKVIRKLCHSSHCGSAWPLGRYAIHRNSGVVSSAGAQKQHQSGRYYLRADGPLEG
jgi:hypothetical protein